MTSRVPDGFFDTVRQAESSGRPNAVNPLTGAAGLYQFIPATWAGVVRNYGERYGLTPDGVFDPQQQQRAMEAITQNEYLPVVQRMGREATPQELYAVHLLGAPAYERMVRGMNSSAADALNGHRVPWDAVWRANRGVFGQDPNITGADALARIGAYFDRNARGNPRPAVRNQAPPPRPQPPKAPPVSPPSPTAQESSGTKATTKRGLLQAIFQGLRSLLRA
jgi:hypothetical protein